MLVEPRGVEVDSLEELLELTTKGVVEHLRPLLFFAYNPSPQPNEYCPNEYRYGIGKDLLQSELGKGNKMDFIS